MNDPDGFTTDAPRTGRRWVVIAVNALLALAIVGLLVATWMPAIYDRFATTRPAP